MSSAAATQHLRDLARLHRVRDPAGTLIRIQELRRAVREDARREASAPAGAGMSALDRLLGTWEITMHHSAMSEPVTGRQRYERVLDGAFVLMRWTYNHPDFPDAMALLSDKRYHYFDVRGVTRVFDFEIDAAGWSMIHLDADFSQRFSARFHGPDAIESTGEASRDYGVTWQPDFTMAYKRVQ